MEGTVEFPGVECGPLCVRKLRDTEADVAVMAKWLTDERVLYYYDGRDNPFDEARVRATYIDEKLGSPETPCIVTYEGRPIGYLQFYPITPAEHVEYGYGLDQVVYGMDQFIGEPEYWNRGIGTPMVRLVLAYLFREVKPDGVVLDPAVENPRAIRTYEKCGFRKVKLLPEHELHEGRRQDSWLMAVTPATFIPE